jgi:hypothetical protein
MHIHRELPARDIHFPASATFHEHLPIGAIGAFGTDFAGDAAQLHGQANLMLVGGVAGALAGG